MCERVRLTVCMCVCVVYVYVCACVCSRRRGIGVSAVRLLGHCGDKMSLLRECVCVWVSAAMCVREGVACEGE